MVIVFAGKVPPGLNVIAALSFGMEDMSRVKVFGKTGYVGPAIKYDDNKIAVGARVSVPF